MIKKVNYILDKTQKIKLFLLLLIIFVGAFVELLGVSSIMPLILVATDESALEKTWYLVKLKEIFNFRDSNEVIVFLSFLLIVVYIIKNIYVTFQYNVQYKFIFNNQRRLAVKMMDSYMHQSYLFHVSRNVAELQRNVTEDVNGFYTVVLNVLQLLAETSVCLVLIVYLMSTDIMTTLVVAIITIIFALLFGLIFKKVLVKKGQENRQVNIRLNKWVLQSFSGIKEIKVMNKESFFLKNYDHTYRKFTILQSQQTMLSFIPRPIMETMCICGLLLTVVIKVMCFQEDISTFVPTLSVFAVAAFRMLPSFNRISGYMSAVMFNKAALDVLYHDLKEIEEFRKDEEDNYSIEMPISNLSKGINVNNISFRYPNVEKWVLNNLSMHIKPNTSVAFIGTSGSGKSTLADIILGVLEPQRGEVEVEGVDIKTHLKEWHQCLGYIPQTIYLMDDTIRANIAFGLDREKIDEEALWAAIREAQLEEFVKVLPEGLDTIIGDRGVKLSGGQRQRIGIARALYSKPKVLILDEATSALDNETEREVMEAIDGLKGTRTLIIIAHRLTTIRNCDVIYEIKNGKAIEKRREEILS